jgi:hypothetical protein
MIQRRSAQLRPRNPVGSEGAGSGTPGDQRKGQAGWRRPDRPGIPHGSCRSVSPALGRRSGTPGGEPLRAALAPAERPARSGRGAGWCCRAARVAGVPNPSAAGPPSLRLGTGDHRGSHAGEKCSRPMTIFQRCQEQSSNVRLYRPDVARPSGCLTLTAGELVPIFEPHRFGRDRDD